MLSDDFTVAHSKSYEKSEWDESANVNKMFLNTVIVVLCKITVVFSCFLTKHING